MEDHMATLELKDCKEAMLFRAVTENDSYLGACKALIAFDKTHPEKKFFKKTSDKEVFRMCFNECRQAVAIAFPRGEVPDFNNVAHLNRLKNVFNQQLPRMCQKYYDDFSSSFKGRIGMGDIFIKHMDYIDRAGLSYYKSLISEQKREASKRSYEQATVGCYRQLGRGFGDKKVFSEKNTYKTNREAVLARMAAERKTKGIA